MLRKWLFIENSASHRLARCGSRTIQESYFWSLSPNRLSLVHRCKTLSEWFFERHLESSYFPLESHHQNEGFLYHCWHPFVFVSENYLYSLHWKLLDLHMYTKTLFLLSYDNKSWFPDADMIDFFLLTLLFSRLSFKSFERIAEALFLF